MVVGNVDGLHAGIYKYRPQGHELGKVAGGDVRAELCAAALDQECIKDGAALLVFAAAYERTTLKYGERGVRYVYMEVGHAARNVYLQAVSFGLGTVVIGLFNDDEVGRLLQMQACWPASWHYSPAAALRYSVHRIKIDKINLTAMDGHYQFSSPSASVTTNS